MTRVMALDHGTRRIGVAIGETETGMAFARPAITGRRAADRLAEVVELLRREGAELVVIGLPLTLEGAESDQARVARAFGDQLAELGVPVAFEDERLSSWAAGEELRDAGRNPDRASGELDSTAARLILQQYLDARRRPEPYEETR